MAGRQGPKRENLQEAALWLPGDPRVTVSRGPAGPGGAAVGLGARLPGPLARLHSGSGEGGPRVMTSMSDSHVNWRREEMQGGRGGRALAGGHSCLHPAGVGQQGSWPLLSLRTADWACPDAPGLSRCPRPALPRGASRSVGHSSPRSRGPSVRPGGRPTALKVSASWTPLGMPPTGELSQDGALGRRPQGAHLRRGLSAPGGRAAPAGNRAPHRPHPRLDGWMHSTPQLRASARYLSQGQM